MEGEAALERRESLSDSERADLALLEDRVEHGLNALYEIRQRGLWREWPSFQAYMASRWGEDSIRRRNQLLAGLRVFDLLHDAIGAGVSLPESEYSVRPIVTLATIDPHKAVEVYQRALTLSDGQAPSQSQVLEARRQVLSEKEIRVEDARLQLAASPYHNLKFDLQGGGDPIKLLALSDMLTASEVEVRRQMIIMDIHDPVLIRMVNEQYQKNAGHLTSLFRSHTLYFSDGSALAFSRAAPRDYRRFLDEAYREHLAAARAERMGQPVSVVVYDHDPLSTLRSLSEVLSYTTLIGLQNLIGAV